MAKHFYTVAQHTFVVGMLDDERGIAMPSYEPFRVLEADGTDLLFTLTVDDTFYPMSKGEHIGDFDCGAADFGVYRLPDGAYQMLISLPGGDYCGLLQATADFHAATIATRGEDSLRTFAVNNALMLMYAFAAADKDTLLVHSSVIKNKGKGYLFLGKSGTGKSTHANLWLQHIPGTERINDDNPTIRIVEGKAYVYGTPWSGKTPCYRNICYPIGGIARLRQAPHNRFKQLEGVEAFVALIPGCMVIKQDMALYDALCDNLTWVAEHVTIGMMECLPDREAAMVMGYGFWVKG